MNKQNRVGAVAAVILAAGRSSRMGRAKQIALVGGIPMVVHAVKIAVQSDANSVWVVTGAHVDVVEPALLPMRQDYSHRLHMVHNDNWATGQASSVRRSIDVVSAETEALLFLPVDQPFLPTDLLQALIVAWRQGALLACPAIDGNMRGAPAIFDRALWPDLLALKGDVGARPLLQRYRAQVVTVPAKDDWLRDIDTPDDLAAIK